MYNHDIGSIIEKIKKEKGESANYLIGTTFLITTIEVRKELLGDKLEGFYKPKEHLKFRFIKEETELFYRNLKKLYMEEIPKETVLKDLEKTIEGSIKEYIKDLKEETEDGVNSYCTGNILLKMLANRNIGYAGIGKILTHKDLINELKKTKPPKAAKDKLEKKFISDQAAKIRRFVIRTELLKYRN